MLHIIWTNKYEDMNLQTQIVQVSGFEFQFHAFFFCLKPSLNYFTIQITIIHIKKLISKENQWKKKTHKHENFSSESL